LRKLIYNLIVTLLLPALCPLGAWAQNDAIANLEAKLEKATDINEQLYIYNQLALASLEVSADKVVEYATKAHDLAVTTGSKAALAQALNLLGKGQAARDGDQKLLLHNRKLLDVNAAIRNFKSSIDYAKSTGNYSLAMDNLEQLIHIAKSRGRENEAIEHYQRFIDMAKQQKGFGSDSQARELASGYDKELRKIKTERAQLEQDKKQLEREIAQLSKQYNEISEDKTQLTKKAKQLSDSKTQAEQKLAETSQTVNDLSREKQKIEKIVKGKDKEIKILVSKAEVDSIQLEQARITAQNAELIANRNKQIRNFLMALSALVLLLAYMFYSRYRTKNKANAELQSKNTIIEKEKQRSDDLLLNILPAPIAEELKQYGAARAQKHEEIAVLFSDFLNFTKIAETLSPDELVRELDYCFKGFDFIISQQHIEKIKTIGDAYMCATGFDKNRINPTLDMVRAALEMEEFLNDYKNQRLAAGRPFFEARIGVHVGPVVAGVVGTKKFAYDIWGDTVNTAARMESSSEAGKVNISDAAYQRVQAYFRCTYRGQMPVKNKGYIGMYFVDSAY
jgi:adenylate cyclase